MAAKILVVDDEADVEMLMRMRFRDRIRRGDFALRFAHTGVQALEQLSVSPDYDLLLTDINMPEMDGLTLLGKVQERYPNLQTVVISAYGDLANIRTAMNRGAFDFITKPMDFQDVEVTIAKTLRYATQMRESRRAEEYRRAKEAAELNLQRLRELEELREGLTQMLVHDLRTPLTSLLTGMQTVGMSGQLNPIQEQCVQTAMQGGWSLLHMVNDLLDIWKMEDGSLRIDPEDIDPDEFLRLVVSRVDDLMKSRSQYLEFQRSPDLPILHADSKLLERVLVNLLGNALKFAPSKSSVRVTLRSLQEYAAQENLMPSARRAVNGAPPDAIVISVSDSGYGIPEDAFERIFEKFGQVELRQTNTKSSSGLGLTFCKMVVEAHAGRIWVESALGQGSTFSFYIPPAWAFS